MIDNRFTLKKLLGKGGSSEVYLATDDQNKAFAIKMLRKDKKYSYERGSKMLKKEHSISTKLESHPNILNSFYSNPDGVLAAKGREESVMYNVIEIAENGPIANYIRITGSIEEDLARLIAIQLINAVSYMHSKSIAHLDIKLENILLDSFFNIKLADMGISDIATSKNYKCAYRKGTVNYMAPEIAELKSRAKFDPFKADVYSLGVWLYMLLIGDFPEKSLIYENTTSTDENESELGKQTSSEVEKNSTKKWTGLSASVKNLLTQMLTIKPEQRPSIEEVLSHDWFRPDMEYQDVLAAYYEEMWYRKDYLKEFTRRKLKEHKKNLIL